MKTNNTLAAVAACLLGWWLLVAPGAAVAAVDDLYAAEAGVSGEDAEERNRAIAAAFRAVLVKLTGDRMVGARTGVEELVGRAPMLVQQYRYRVAEPAGDAAPARFLWVRFDAAAVDRLLAERSWPVWRAPRSRLLAWLSVEADGRRGLLSAETEPVALQALRERAAQRGVAVQLPLLDLEDQARLTAADLWSGFEEPIRGASQRYGEGPVLVGRLKLLGQGRWQPDWLLLGAEGKQGFSGAPGGLAEILAAGVDEAVDRLAARHAPSVAVSGPAPARVTVSGVYDLPDYAAVLQVMGAAGGVGRLALRSVSGDTLVFDVWLDGGAAALVDQLGAEPRLRAQPETGLGNGELSRLNYQWAP